MRDKILGIQAIREATNETMQGYKKIIHGYKEKLFTQSVVKTTTENLRSKVDIINYYWWQGNKGGPNVYLPKCSEIGIDETGIAFFVILGKKFELNKDGTAYLDSDNIEYKNPILWREEGGFSTTYYTTPLNRLSVIFSCEGLRCSGLQTLQLSFATELDKSKPIYAGYYKKDKYKMDKYMYSKEGKYLGHLRYVKNNGTATANPPEPEDYVKLYNVDNFREDFSGEVDGAFGSFHHLLLGESISIDKPYYMLPKKIDSNYSSLNYVVHGDSAPYSEGCSRMLFTTIVVGCDFMGIKDLDIPLAIFRWGFYNYAKSATHSSEIEYAKGLKNHEIEVLKSYYPNYSLLWCTYR